jgi:hypothetical protein
MTVATAVTSILNNSNDNNIYNSSKDNNIKSNSRNKNTEITKKIDHK